MHSILTLLGPIGIICIFKDIKLQSKIINWIAASVLGIYLIQGNKNTTPFVYNIWFPTNDYKENYFFYKYIYKGILILGISLFIDIIRRYTIGLLFKKLITKIINF